MAGFGIRALKKVQDDESQKTKREYFQHIVYGENYFAVLTYLKLIERFGIDKVKLISENPVSKDSITTQLKCSVSTLRDEVIAKKLLEKTPRLEILPNESENVFYKDAKFHKFGGRAKPHELMEDEEEFIDPNFQLKIEGLFTDEHWENLNEILAKGQLNKYLTQIDVTKPTDLVEKTNFKLFTGEYETFECEKLYWCESPKSFYKRVENKNELSDELGSYCTALEERTGLVVHFDCDKEVYDSFGTVFLPQSATHEWGHFIADINKKDIATDRQEFSCLMFVNEDEVNEEDLAKKIKLMKRVLERVLPDFGKTNYSEKIYYSRQLLIKNTQDENFKNYKDEAVSFIGQGAPIGAEDSEKVKFIPRGILSYLEL